MSERNYRKVRQGIVVSDKADKTVIVSVQRQVIHPKYGRIVRKRKKYAAHDELNDCHMGDSVKIMETRPISKRKRWRVFQVLERAR